MLQINDFVIDKPEEELFAYHRSTMTSPEIFELEQQRIFETCWLYLGHSASCGSDQHYPLVLRPRRNTHVSIQYTKRTEAHQ